MWQRFSENARKVVFYAQEEAQRSGDGYVSTEHLLLGLLREPHSSAGQVLLDFGYSGKDIRRRVEEHMSKGKVSSTSEMNLTPRAKRVIDLAYAEARELNQNYIGSEHLLLGLIREGEGLAGLVLVRLGLELESVREAVRARPPGAGRPAAATDEERLRMLGEHAETLLTDRAKGQVLEHMLRVRRNLSPVDQVCAVLLSEDGQPASQLLKSLNVNPQHVLILVERALLQPPTLESLPDIVPPVSALMAASLKIAQSLGQEPTAAHFLLAVIGEGSSHTAKTVMDFGITYERALTVASEQA